MCVTTSKLVVLRQKVYAYIERNPQNWERRGRASLRYGVAAALAMRPFPSCLILPYLVVLGQTVRACY